MSNCKFHLQIKELNLYPSLSSNTIEMIEQVMNAVLIPCSQNLQEAINRLVTLEQTCAPITHNSYDSVIQAITPICTSFGIDIITAEVANQFILHHYNNRLKHYNGSKLADINHQFSTLKKVTYDGTRIQYLPVFFDWIYELAHQQHTFIVNNPEDDLMTQQIFPNLIDHIQGALDTIEEQTLSYTNQLRYQFAQVRKSLS